MGRGDENYLPPSPSCIRLQAPNLPPTSHPPQLWNVCYKSQWARVEIPELEFELSQDGKKHIDSIYNHLAGAVYNLGAHISGPGGMMSDDSKCKISECLGQVSVREPRGTLRGLFSAGARVARCLPAA